MSLLPPAAQSISAPAPLNAPRGGRREKAAPERPIVSLRAVRRCTGRRALLAATMVGLATGCVGIGDFDPVGDSASIAGAWLVDGESPTAAKCAQLGAIRIQVSFLDMQRSVTHSGLRFECPSASFDTDGPGGSGKVVATPEASESPWRLRLEAVDDSGTVIAFGDTYTVFVPQTERIEMPTTDFATSTIVARWTLGGRAPNPDRCADAGIERVEFEVAQLDGVMQRGVEACQLGSVGVRVYPRDTPYTVRLTVIGTDGATRAATTPIDVTAEAGASIELEGSPFDLDRL